MINLELKRCGIYAICKKAGPAIPLPFLDLNICNKDAHIMSLKSV